MTLITTAQAAQLCRYAQSTIRRACAEGKIECEKWGTDYLMTEQALMAWVNDPAAHKRGNPHSNIKR